MWVEKYSWMSTLQCLDFEHILSNFTSASTRIVAVRNWIWANAIQIIYGTSKIWLDCRWILIVKFLNNTSGFIHNFSVKFLLAWFDVLIVNWWAVFGKDGNDIFIIIFTALETSLHEYRTFQVLFPQNLLQSFLHFAELFVDVLKNYLRTPAHSSVVSWCLISEKNKWNYKFYTCQNQNHCVIMWD